MIKKLELINFTVFKKATLTFGDKLNVIIGGNGSGKTQLLKILYAWTQGYFTSIVERSNGTGGDSSEFFQRLFKCDNTLNDLVNYDALKKQSRSTKAVVKINYTFNGNEAVSELQITPRMHGSLAQLNFPNPLEWEIFNGTREQGIFLPARDLLTLYPNYLSLSKMYHLPYDETYEDTIVKLGIPYLREESKEFKSLIHDLEESIHGKIYLQNERFYYHAENAPKELEQDINMTAEGWRKLGMVLQLLKNGGLHTGMALFWDEPEANLNPQLIRLIAQVIVELSKLDIQIFITTHSLFLLNELEIVIAQQKITKGVRFFDLRHGMEPQQGNTRSALKNILLLDEDMKQSDRYMEEV